MARKLKIEISSIENLRDLLQETYDLANEQLIAAQNEMNKLANSTKLQEEVMQSKKDYAKAMNDYMMVKDKAISKKLEIAKLMSELVKHSGDAEQNIDTSFGSFNFDNIRELLDNDNNKTESIKLNK